MRGHPCDQRTKEERNKGKRNQEIGGIRFREKKK
jgi:hypothetical protein